MGSISGRGGDVWDRNDLAWRRMENFADLAIPLPGETCGRDRRPPRSRSATGGERLGGGQGGQVGGLAPCLQSKPYNDLLLQPLLGGGQVGCGLLRGWRDLHPIVLPPLHRDPVLCRLGEGGERFYTALDLYLVSHLLHKLVLEGFKAVETDRGHVAVLHGDRPLGRLVLPQEREVLQHDMQLKRTRLWCKIPFGPCFLDSKNVSREFPKCIQEIRAVSSVFGLGQRVQVIIHVVATVSVGKLLLRSEFDNILDFVFGLV